MRKKPGDAVAEGEPVLELHYNDDRRLEDAVRLVASALVIEPTAPAARPLVLDHVT